MALRDLSALLSRRLKLASSWLESAVLVTGCAAGADEEAAPDCAIAATGAAKIAEEIADATTSWENARLDTWTSKYWVRDRRIKQASLHVDAFDFPGFVTLPT